MKPRNFAHQLEESVKNIFPHSRINVNISGRFGASVTLHFTIGQKEEWPNGIDLNDFARHVIMIWMADKSEIPSEMPAKVQVSCAHGGSFCIKPKERHLYCSRQKVGWRNFSGDAETALRRITAYFEKLKQTIADNLDNLLPDHKALAEKKI